MNLHKRKRFNLHRTYENEEGSRSDFFYFSLITANKFLEIFNLVILIVPCMKTKKYSFVTGYCSKSNLEQCQR